MSRTASNLAMYIKSPVTPFDKLGEGGGGRGWGRVREGG